jgi:aldehyde:ferredoxin oxidoreductase
MDRELKFGDYRFGIELLHQIAYRRGIGDFLAEGVRSAAKKIGKNAEKFAMQVKGLEFPAYDPRAGYGIALAYAVSPRGACHRRAWPPRIELLGNLPPDTIEGKPEIVKEMFDENAIFHSLLVCDFPCKMAPLKVKDFTEYLHAISGIQFSESDLWALADRTETRIRLFNLGEGLSRAEDTLPPRTFDEALPGGPRKGARIHRQPFEEMLKRYYQIRGWDEEGIPLPGTLQRLAIPFC